MRAVMISFDLEEFDILREYNASLSIAQEMKIGQQAVLPLLALLDKYKVRATFFTTANFALQYPNLIKQVAVQHEIASHAYWHTGFETEDYAKSKTVLEKIIDKKIYGFRMPRLAPVNFEALHQAGYTYDSSLNPTYMPGRYNNLKASKYIFRIGEIAVIPTAVSPLLRVPLFWLSFKNFPFWLFNFFLNNTLKSNQPLCLYFHPWEFTDLSDFKKLPFIVRRNSGDKMFLKFEKLLKTLDGKVEYIGMRESLD
jgi:Polysaccharide deacetylase/Domain of unknown function (DUF3473)